MPHHQLPKANRVKPNRVSNITVLALFFTGYIAHVVNASENMLHAQQSAFLVADASQSNDREQEFLSSLQEFDEKILRELEETQQARQENARQKAALRSDSELESEDQSQGEGQAASADGSSSSEEGNRTESATAQENTHQADKGTAEETVAANKQQSEDASQEQQRTSKDASQEQQRTSNTPVADIPTGNDDDVIARQLREAAEAEADPQVKEKLWEEYRKYKNQQNSAP